jgi:hypothetical protein
MDVRLEKILHTVLYKAHGRQVEETIVNLQGSGRALRELPGAGRHNRYISATSILWS